MIQHLYIVWLSTKTKIHKTVFNIILFFLNKENTAFVYMKVYLHTSVYYEDSENRGT